MDTTKQKDDFSLAQVGFYASMSFIVVSALGALLYMTCFKKYRLNWFEKNLLETANESENGSKCEEALVPVNMVAGGIVSEPICENRLGNMTPSALAIEDPVFWVPPARAVQQQISVSAEDSPPQTPNSPTGSLRSNTLSMASTSSMSLSRAGSRRKVASMNAKLDHTKIDMTLYKTNSQQKSESPIHAENKRGQLLMEITYDPIAGILCVSLIEAKSLQPRGFSGTADPYAKIRLLPEKKKFWQTRIHKKTLNPVFDEEFVFEENLHAIDKRIIEILVYDFDAFSRHVCIGGVKIPLNEVDLTEKIKLWAPLGNCAEQDFKVDLGDLMISLAYLPSAERLTVVIIKARNLRVVDDTRNSSDPYVKVTLYLNDKKLKKRKTGLMKNTTNPVYNEALTFDITKDTLKKVLIEFSVMHDSLLGSSEVLGRALIGNSPEVHPDEKIFFEEMFRAKSSTAKWIPLQEANNTRSNSISQH